MLGGGGVWAQKLSDAQGGSLSLMNSTTGVQGQLFFNTTYNAYFTWSFDRWWPFGNPDPRYGFLIYDEFNGADRIQSLDWGNAGAATSGNLLNTGVVNISQSAASGITDMRTELDSIQLGTMDLYLETLISIPTLATAGDDGSLTIGMSDNASFSAHSTCTDGVFFVLDRSVNGANWIINTSSNGTATNTNTATAVVAGTWYRLGIYVSASTQAQFYVNGVSQGTIASNLPTGASRQTGFHYASNKTVGAAALNILADYFCCYGFYNGQRVA